jgi:hypothetical protein
MPAFASTGHVPANAMQYAGPNNDLHRAAKNHWHNQTIKDSVVPDTPCPEPASNHP